MLPIIIALQYNYHGFILLATRGLVGTGLHLAHAHRVPCHLYVYTTHTGHPPADTWSHPILIQGTRQQTRGLMYS